MLDTNALLSPPRLQRSLTAPITVHSARSEALFHSVRAALAFAYSIPEFAIASSPSLLLYPSGGSGRLACLTPHEKHAQGALIRRAAEQRLKGMDLAVTFAFYGAGRMRSGAIREVGWEVAKLVRTHGLGVELAKRHFSRNGERKSQTQLAAEFGLSQTTISKLDLMVGDEIDRLRLAAEAKLETLFVATGIAESV